ncbi:MAG: hypothetical protein LCH77_07440 [Actinobacteria bacterium]|uniref:Transcriptional regulator n=1 Tax=Nostocoides veronense TaxID=330836 RepID=A0ABP4Y5W8_9MICO|nr:hypothetical protein [Actinomycetota bacterium]
MDQTWTVRDLPVLRAIVELYEETGQIVSPNQIEAKTGLAAEVVQSALRALDSEQPPYVMKMQRYSSGHVVMIGAPTGHARRAVGAWPTAETIADRLVSALDGQQSASQTRAEGLAAQDGCIPGQRRPRSRSRDRSDRDQPPDGDVTEAAVSNSAADVSESTAEAAIRLTPSHTSE